MLKQLCLDIWIANKQSPINLLMKIICILFALFSGILIRGFPYTFLGAICCIFILNRDMESKDFGKGRRQPEISYLIPRSVSMIKRYEIWKGFVTSLFYAVITVAGYGFTIGSSKDLELDREMIVFLFAVFCYMLLVAFCMYIRRGIADYLNLEFMYVRKNFKKGMNLNCILGYSLAMISMITFLYYKFAPFKVHSFLQNPVWRGILFTVMVLALGMLLFDAWYSVKRLVIGDYQG